MTKTTAKTKNAPPAARLKVASCQAAIWENTGDDGKVRRSVTFKRGYKKQTGEWANAHDYNLQGLLAHRALVDLAIAKLVELNGTPQPAAAEIPDDGDYIEDEVAF